MLFLTIKGTRYKPELTLSLRNENGEQQRVNDAQTKAHFLLAIWCTNEQSDLGRML